MWIKLVKKTVSILLIAKPVKLLDKCRNSHVFPANGEIPVKAINVTTPTDHMSVNDVTGRSITISGATKSGIPRSQ